VNRHGGHIALHAKSMLVFSLGSFQNLSCVNISLLDRLFLEFYVVMKQSISIRFLLISLLSALALVGCSNKQVKEEAPEPVAPPPVTETAPTPPPVSDVFGPGDLDTHHCLQQRVVYFDFDQDAVKSEFSDIMGCHAKYLRDRPSARITLQGHADERGSRAYNLGLGERRGNAVNAALQGNGGAADQLSVVSYGEERPVCTESEESCWQQNRRVEIVYSAR